MYVAMLTREDKIAYHLNSRLRGVFPNANIDTLRQISVYVARSGYEYNNEDDLEIRYDDKKDMSVLALNNGIHINFNDESSEFGFVITKNEGKFFMSTLVYLNNPDDMSSVNVYSELRVKGYGMYVVTFRPKDFSNENSLKYGSINYYTEDEIDWVKEIAEEDIDNNFDLVAKKNFIYPFSEGLIKDFDLLEQNDISLDCYQGYVSNVLTRIDLLYDNMKFIRIKRKKKEKI